MSLGLLLALSPFLYLLRVSPLLGLHGLALCLYNGFVGSSAQLEVHFLLQVLPHPLLPSAGYFLSPHSISPVPTEVCVRPTLTLSKHLVEDGGALIAYLRVEPLCPPPPVTYTFYPLWCLAEF